MVVWLNLSLCVYLKGVLIRVHNLVMIAHSCLLESDKRSHRLFSVFLFIFKKKSKIPVLKLKDKKLCD